LGNEVEGLLLDLKEKNISAKFIDRIISANKKKELGSDTMNQDPEDNLPKPSIGDLTPLTRRELVVLACVADGLRNKEISDKLFNSETTIKKHISNMLVKLNASNRMALVAKAKELGILRSSE
jgi:DNA-binding NarL/FixJ family response regulator